MSVVPNLFFKLRFSFFLSFLTRTVLVCFKPAFLQRTQQHSWILVTSGFFLHDRATSSISRDCVEMFVSPCSDVQSGRRPGFNVHYVPTGYFYKHGGVVLRCGGGSADVM